MNSNRGGQSSRVTPRCNSAKPRPIGTPPTLTGRPKPVVSVYDRLESIHYESWEISDKINKAAEKVAKLGSKSLEIDQNALVNEIRQHSERLTAVFKTYDELFDDVAAVNQREMNKKGRELEELQKSHQMQLLQVDMDNKRNIELVRVNYAKRENDLVNKLTKMDETIKTYRQKWLKALEDVELWIGEHRQSNMKKRAVNLSLLNILDRDFESQFLDCDQQIKTNREILSSRNNISGQGGVPFTNRSNYNNNSNIYDETNKENINTNVIMPAKLPKRTTGNEAKEEKNDQQIPYVRAGLNVRTNRDMEAPPFFLEKVSPINANGLNKNIPKLKKNNQDMPLQFQRHTTNESEDSSRMFSELSFLQQNHQFGGGNMQNNSKSDKEIGGKAAVPIPQSEMDFHQTSFSMKKGDQGGWDPAFEDESSLMDNQNNNNDNNNKPQDVERILSMLDQLGMLNPNLKGSEFKGYVELVKQAQGLQEKDNNNGNKQQKAGEISAEKRSRNEIRRKSILEKLQLQNISCESEKHVNISQQINKRDKNGKLFQETNIIPETRKHHKPGCDPSISSILDGDASFQSPLPKDHTGKEHIFNHNVNEEDLLRADCNPLGVSLMTAEVSMEGHGDDSSRILESDLLLNASNRGGNVIGVKSNLFCYGNNQMRGAKNLFRRDHFQDDHISEKDEYESRRVTERGNSVEPEENLLKPGMVMMLKNPRDIIVPETSEQQHLSSVHVNDVGRTGTCSTLKDKATTKNIFCITPLKRAKVETATSAKLSSIPQGRSMGLKTNGSKNPHQQSISTNTGSTGLKCGKIMLGDAIGTTVSYSRMSLPHISWQPISTNQNIMSRIVGQNTIEEHQIYAHDDMMLDHSYPPPYSSMATSTKGESKVVYVKPLLQKKGMKLAETVDTTWKQTNHINTNSMVVGNSIKLMKSGGVGGTREMTHHGYSLPPSHNNTRGKPHILEN